jgi:hypothetical protein
MKRHPRYHPWTCSDCGRRVVGIRPVLHLSWADFLGKAWQHARDLCPQCAQKPPHEDEVDVEATLTDDGAVRFAVLLDRLDPRPQIRRDVEQGIPQQVGVRAYAQDIWARVDKVFRHAGVTGVTVDEMEAYVQRVIEQVGQE